MRGWAERNWRRSSNQRTLFFRPQFCVLDSGPAHRRMTSGRSPRQTRLRKSLPTPRHNLCDLLPPTAARYFVPLLRFPNLIPSPGSIQALPLIYFGAAKLRRRGRKEEKAAYLTPSCTHSFLGCIIRVTNSPFSAPLSQPLVIVFSFRLCHDVG